MVVKSLHPCGFGCFGGQSASPGVARESPAEFTASRRLGEVCRVGDADEADELAHEVGLPQRLNWR
jgi:hypothetical protein